jgi:hypothetical protein
MTRLDGTVLLVRIGAGRYWVCWAFLNCLLAGAVRDLSYLIYLVLEVKLLLGNSHASNPSASINTIRVC